MSEHVYKSVELTGSSQTSVEDAVRNAVSKASKSLHNLRWFEVVSLRGQIDGGDVEHWQVTMKVGFTLEE
ncbi:MAG: dodecin [Myxococcota bacterium]|nr:dodecin [Myxococcota bacterium]